MAAIDLLENDLLACLCDVLADEGRPVCVCSSYPGGDRPPMVSCGRSGVANGHAWLSRTESTWMPTGNAAVWGGRWCASDQAWLTTIDLGVYRCSMSVPDETGQIVESAYPADRELMDADTQSLLRVLCCSVWDEVRDVFAPVSVSVDRLTPEGGCMGVVLRLVVSGDVALSVFPGEGEGDGEGEVWVSVPAG